MKPGPLNSRNLLLALLLGLAALPAQARDDDYRSQGPMQAMLAQLTPEERQALRERWEQASPEERLKLRREFRERMLRQRDGLGDRWSQEDRRGPPVRDDRERTGRDDRDDQGSFGTGFERRRHENGRFENLPPRDVPYPGEFFDRRGGRDGSRDGGRDR